MGTTSIWRGTSRSAGWPAASGDIRCDVAIVGGGITGVTLAALLAEQGRSVVLLEAHEIAGGDTGNSTGNLYETVSGGLSALRHRWDAQAVRQVVDSRREALDFIVRNAGGLGAQGIVRRCPMYVYAGNAEAQPQIEAEAEAAQDAGLPVRRAESLPPGVPPARGSVLVLEGQAQCHPAAYVLALASRAAERGCRLFEHSAVQAVDGDTRTVSTAHAVVQSREIVLATHSPCGFHWVQAGMVPRREYGLAARAPSGAFPAGIFWRQGEPRLSVRGLAWQGGEYVICVGEQHKTGQHDPQAAMSALERAAGEHLGLATPHFRWSAQNFQSADGLPYIGRDAAGVFIATGFGTDGLVWGTLAAHLIADEIAGRANHHAELYRAARFTPAKSVRGFGEETASVVKAVLRDYLTQREQEQLASLQAGQAAIVELDGERVAAWRDPHGELHAVSPVCTHLKCQVHWNALETSWDCPCHGSRFAPDGQVIEGPALVPLARRSARASAP